MESQPHILVVDDHRDIREPLAKFLAKHGFRVSQAESALAARRALQASSIDLVVLDIMMPGEDGLSLCRSIREGGTLPVILLTAVAEEMDRIIGLEMGADDYVTKPFNPRELVARIKSVLRRTHTMPPDQGRFEANELTFDRWSLNTARRELLSPEGVAVPLSTGEFGLLSAFLKYPGRTLSRDQLLDLTKGRDARLFDRAVDNQVSRLRQKIERDPKEPEIIKTVWGGGYIFTAEVKSQ